jgi:hypothetical protein
MQDISAIKAKNDKIDTNTALSYIVVKSPSKELPEDY